MIVALASLFVTTYATELELQLNWDGASMVQTDAAPAFKNRPSAGISSNPMPKPRPDSAQALVTPAFQNPIHPEDASASSNPAFDIKSSGRYYLSNDFKIPVTTSGASFIRINADNVTLDMNSKVIAPHAGATQTNLVGITVNDKDNVQILNGTIQCDDTDSTPTQRITTGISLGSTATNYSIKVNDVFVNRALTNGITCTNANDISLERVSVNNCSGSAAVTGLSLTTCKNVVLRDCEFNRNTTSSGNCKGISLSGCEDGVFANVISSGNTTSSTSDGDIAIGIGLASSCKNLIFLNCSASNNASSGQSSDSTMHSMGVEVNASPLNRFEGCTANGNGGSSGSDNNVAGFHVIGASHSCEFVSCEASRNYTEQSSATSPITNGFRVNGNGAAINNLLFNDCVANYNEAGATSSDAAGFYFSGLASSRVLNCSANKNLADAADSYGFFFNQSSSNGNSNNLISDCKAKGNTASTATKNAIGFYSTSGTNNRYVKCKSSGQSAGAGSTSTEGSGGSGFQLVSETRSQVVNCEAVGNATSTHANAYAYGIYLSSATNCSVRDCYLAYNTAGASGKHFGLYDASTATSSLFISNVSVGHGKCLTSVELNASMQWKTTSSIPDASQNYFYNHAGTSVNPQNMVHEIPKWNLTTLSTSVKLWENVSIY